MSQKTEKANTPAIGEYCPYINRKAPEGTCQRCKTHICDDKTFFCLVVGSRSITDYTMISYVLDRMLRKQNKVVIVTGDAKGVDACAARYAIARNLPLLVYPADWDAFGKKAGYLRNREMHEFLSKQPHKGVTVFWDGHSRGTQHSFDLAAEYHNPIKTVRVPRTN